MMGVLQKNKTFFIFLGKFVLSYLLLSFLYWLFLNQYDAAKLEPDGMTRIVAEQTRDLANFLGGDTRIRKRNSEASYKFYINDAHIVRIVEGCNAVSVMILFAAFIVAFSTTFKRTSLYILAGLLIIHILNIVRIIFIAYAVYYYRQYSRVLHDVVFPLFIYGVVFTLWIMWVIKFSGNAKSVKA